MSLRVILGVLDRLPSSKVSLIICISLNAAQVWALRKFDLLLKLSGSILFGLSVLLDKQSGGLLDTLKNYCASLTKTGR